MSLTNNHLSYHDLNSLQSIRSQAKQDEQLALRQAAEQFEAIFMNMLLSSMRKANEVFEADGLMNSQTTKFYQDMHDNQLATELAQKGSLGLADILVQQLSPLAKKSKPAATTEALALPVRPALRQQNVVAETEKADWVSLTEPTEIETTKAEWQVKSPLDFIRAILPSAQQAAPALGLDPLALVAQAALETGWGQRMIKTAKGENSFNLFGIKANRSWKGDTAVVDTLEYRQGVAQKEQAKFRSYTSPEQSVADYVDFISNSGRYQDAVQVAAEPDNYFTQLQAAGYATDPNYAQKVMAVYKSPAFEQFRASDAEAKEIPDAAE